MDVNEKYANLYHTDFSLYRAMCKAARDAAVAEWNRRIAAERKRRKLKKKENLPDEWCQELMIHLSQKHNWKFWDELADRIKEEKAKRIGELAESVVFTPDPDCWYLVESRDSGEYSTQGYGAETYAKGRLKPLELKLKALGIETHVRRVVTWRDPRAQYFREGCRFELWASCPEWMADAARHRITFKEWVTACNAAGVNIRVFNPFIPHTIDQYTPEYGWGQRPQAPAGLKSGSQAAPAGISG